MNNEDFIAEQARNVLEQNRVAVFIVAYNAEKHIQQVLQRIPSWIAERLAEIFIIDDHSSDNTVAVAETLDWSARNAPLNIYRTPYNQGYGGNQRLGYLYAIAQSFDIVVLLHGDGQYAPEALPHLLAPYAENADAVFGSRFLDRWGPLKGGMPLYKWLGNRILTGTQNLFLGSHLSEMHSGYRSYRVSALKRIPFQNNDLGFSFDADIIVQLIAAGFRITEVPIPTYYGDEICRVNGMKYAYQCLKTVVKYRLMQYEIFYDPKFDVRAAGSSVYTAKEASTSLHHFIRNAQIAPGTKLLDVGGGQGEAVGKRFAERGIDVTCIDQYADPGHPGITQITMDLDRPWSHHLEESEYDTVVALDVLEHLKSPEHGASEIFRHMKSGGKLYASTGNVAFFPLRLALLAGWFNYGRRGILDLTHQRLFTVASFRRLLKNAGFRLDRIQGFGPPLRDLSNSKSFVLNLADGILAWLARKWPTLFAYQILIVCTRTDAPLDLMDQTFNYSASASASASSSKSVHHNV